MYGICSKQQQDDIPLVLIPGVGDWAGPYAAAILCGRGVTRYFDSLQHVARGRAHSWYHFEVATTKVTTCRGDQNDNKTITKTITFGVKNGPCETLPTFDDVYLVLGIPDMNHCS